MSPRRSLATSVLVPFAALVGLTCCGDEVRRVDWKPTPTPRVLAGEALAGRWECRSDVPYADGHIFAELEIDVLDPAPMDDDDSFGPGTDYATIAIGDDVYVLRFMKADDYWGVRGECESARCARGDAFVVEAYEADEGRRELVFLWHADDPARVAEARRRDALSYVRAD